jgi:ribosomal protein L40E
VGPEPSMKLFKGSKQKCIKCGAREPTGADGLCDNCRYLVLLDNVIESRTAAAAA